METVARVYPSILNFATPQISLDDLSPHHLSGYRIFSLVGHIDVVFLLIEVKDKRLSLATRMRGFDRV